MSSMSSVAEVEQEAALRAAARSRTMLETREISHRFGDNLVLNRVSFRVGEARFTHCSARTAPARPP